MLDGFVLAISLVDLLFAILGVNMQQLQALKALRTLRALLPIRVISKDEGMKLIVNALLASIPSMSNVLLMCSLFILIFSIKASTFSRYLLPLRHRIWGLERSNRPCHGDNQI